MESGNRLTEIAEEIATLVEEYKNICKQIMTDSEYEMFKYRTLAHLEPTITQNNNCHLSIDSLEEVAERFCEEEEDEEDEEDEYPIKVEPHKIWP